jgi:hypothetical protein
MEFPPFFQGPQFPTASVPDGFAIVPLHLFLVMANQFPMPAGSMTVTAIAKPKPAESFYERAMACSAN